jgi:hypothetical protein
MDIKSYTKPLKELIAELQALENANPGILCMVNDHEHGGDVPQVEISKFYINEHDHVIIVDEKKIENNKLTVEFYNQDPQEMWNSFTDEERGEEPFEEWKANFEKTKAFFEKDKQEFETSVPVVVIYT